MSAEAAAPERTRDARRTIDGQVVDGRNGREVTFLGRGLAVRSGMRLRLLICPLCSQRNGRRGAERGVCEWCAYEPSLRDAEPL